MARYHVFTFVTMDGYITVPDNIPDDKAYDYISKHYRKVRFEEPWIDYSDACFEIEKVDENGYPCYEQ